MAYIIDRNGQFYVVAYDGLDANTGKERRRWYPAGRSHDDAEAIAARLTAARHGAHERAPFVTHRRTVPVGTLAPTTT